MTTIDERHGFIRALKEERAGRVAYMREMLDRAKQENRSLEGEERAALDRVDSTIADLDEQIAGWEARIAGERSADEHRARSGFGDIVRPASTSTVTSDGNTELRALLVGGQSFELRTNLNTVTTTAGGYTVPTTLYPQIRDYLVGMSAVWKLNATRITTTSGEPLDIPVNDHSGTAAIVGEGTALAESDPTFTKVTLHSFKYGRLLQITNEMLADNAVDLTGFIARETARALSNGYGDNFVRGTGTNQPQGYMNGMTVGGTSQTGGTGQPSYADLVTLLYSVPVQYRNTNCQWVASDSAMASIRKLTTTQGAPIWEPAVVAGAPDVLLGYEVVTDPYMTALGTAAGTSVCFGDFSGWYLRDVGMRFETSRDFAFNADITTYRVVQRLDSRWVDKSGVRGLLSPTT